MFNKLRSKKGEYTIGVGLVLLLVSIGHIGYATGKMGDGGEWAVDNQGEWKTAWYSELSPNGGHNGKRK